MKQVVFNVGGALSVYTEFYQKKLLIDLGKSTDFNPVTDFLLPLYKKRGNNKSTLCETKYHIDQLIISHPHNDHISSIKEFDKYFYPKLLTCPNDNNRKDGTYNKNDKINWDKLEPNHNVDILRDMMKSRYVPLEATNPMYQFIYYIQPVIVENNHKLSSESYLNNISIVTYIKINGTNVFLPGDLQKEGTEYIIKNNSGLRNKIGEGIDILIAPHHGLRSSFSINLFKYMKNEKTRCLNIVSEKPKTEDSDRVVDSRYSSRDYCKGENNLSNENDIVCQIKTSRGHIFIYYEEYGNPNFEIVNDKDYLIEKFL